MSAPSRAGAQAPLHTVYECSHSETQVELEERRLITKLREAYFLARYELVMLHQRKALTLQETREKRQLIVACRERQQRTYAAWQNSLRRGGTTEQVERKKFVHKCVSRFHGCRRPSMKSFSAQVSCGRLSRVSLHAVELRNVQEPHLQRLQRGALRLRLRSHVLWVSDPQLPFAYANPALTTFARFRRCSVKVTCVIRTRSRP